MVHSERITKNILRRMKMKKFIAMLLALVMVMALAACGNTNPSETTPNTNAPETTTPETTVPPTTESNDDSVMSYEEFVAAELDSAVVVETYVQTIESWWDGACHIYAQSEDGGYYIYGYACTEEEANKLVPGTKILVSGYKAEWSGEVEIIDATIEILEGSYIVEEAFDATSLLGTDDLATKINTIIMDIDMEFIRLVPFTDLVGFMALVFGGAGLFVGVVGSWTSIRKFMDV